MGVDTVLYARVPRVLTDDEVRRAAVRAQVALGRRVLWVEANGNRYRRDDSGPRHSLQAMRGTPDETHISVNTFARYYGPGYERGPIVDILAVVKFIRLTWPDAVVYYGGDSEDDVAELTIEREEELWKHLCTNSGRAYFQHARSDERKHRCTFCDIEANTSMWSGGDSGCYCPSCHRSWLLKANGSIVETKSDWKTPADGKGYVDEIKLPKSRLQAIIDQLQSGDKAGHAAIELECLIAECES